MCVCWQQSHLRPPPASALKSGYCGWMERRFRLCGISVGSIPHIYFYVLRMMMAIACKWICQRFMLDGWLEPTLCGLFPLRYFFLLFFAGRETPSTSSACINKHTESTHNRKNTRTIEKHKTFVCAQVCFAFQQSVLLFIRYICRCCCCRCCCCPSSFPSRYLFGLQ